VQQGNSINLTWVQAVKNISGFRIERKIEGEATWTEIASPGKTISTWVDLSITGGKLYEYRIVAFAGNNESNFATVQIKPLLTATLTTAIPSEITATSALLGGTITTDGSVTITERGVCWATTTSPTTSDNKLAIYTGTGAFNSTITELTGNTTYYVRAYAIINQGTAYGNEVSFKTSLVLFLPTLTTSTPTNIDITSATLGGNITSDGNATVTERGICYSNSPSPNTTNSKLAIGTGTGIYSNSINGLTANTTYYVRSYAINSQGTAYGNEVSFKTWFGEVTDIENNVYKTVKIGSQVWMAENLKTTKYNDGTTIPNVADNATWEALTTGAYCWYNNDAATYKAIYGALYNWHSVNSNKLAPKGWHVPTDAEWTILTTYLGGESIAGGKLKETGTSHWGNPNTGATNETGFTAVPAGAREPNGPFDSVGGYELLWSSNEENTYFAWGRKMYWNYSKVGRQDFTKLCGLSVRCIKD